MDLEGGILPGGATSLPRETVAAIVAALMPAQSPVDDTAGLDLDSGDDTKDEDDEFMSLCLSHFFVLKKKRPYTWRVKSGYFE